MKHLQVLVVSDQKHQWKDTDNITFKYYAPEDHLNHAEVLSADWDFAILDETLLGYLATSAIAQRLNDARTTPIIYLVEDLESVKQQDRKYVYSIGIFNKTSDHTIQKIGVETFMHQMSARSAPQIKDAVFVFEKDDFYQKIPIQEILWIEALKSGCRIITMRRPYQVSVTLQEFERRFKHPSIVRIHDEYLVNINKVSGFDADSTVIHQSRLPFSMNFRDSVTQHFNLIGERF